MGTTLAHGTYTKETPTKNYPLKFQKSMNSNKLEKDLKKKKKSLSINIITVGIKASTP